MPGDPSWISILPPVVAIGLAMLTRQVILALFAGVWLGAFLLAGFNPFTATMRSLDTYVLGALADSDHASVVLFTLLLGGMVGVIARSGGAQGLAGWVSRFASNRRRGQLAGWFMGLFIFFDDYANTLLVGPTLRPVTDRLGISREKLAFIVDTTAAPVASLAFLSSWIGMEIGLIAEQLKVLGIQQDAYVVFLQSIPHRFYPVLMLFFGMLLASTRRDFGPMLKAERRASLEGKPMRDGAQPAASIEDAEFSPKEGIRPRWYNALVPIGLVLVAMCAGLAWDGYQKTKAAGLSVNLNQVLAQASSYRALLWASLTGCLGAILLSWCQRTLRISEAFSAWLAGVRSLVLAMVILLLAWSLGAVCRELHTAEFLVSALGSWLYPSLLPALTFLVAAAVSFATGTSWGTMGILFPLVMPLTHALSPGDQSILLGTISSILAGSVFGDHCSPISDTTVMSSMASACDHIDHVRTQLPYAVLVAVAGTLFGDLACGLGLWNVWVGLLLGAAALWGWLWIFGKPSDKASVSLDRAAGTK